MAVEPVRVRFNVLSKPDSLSCQTRVSGHPFQSSKKPESDPIDDYKSLLLDAAGSISRANAQLKTRKFSKTTRRELQVLVNRLELLINTENYTEVRDITFRLRIAVDAALLELAASDQYLALR